MPEKLAALFEPARYKVVRGGRGSGKSWGIARALLIEAYQRPLRILCAREVQKSIKQSVHQLLKDQIEAMGLGYEFEVLSTEIRGKNGSAFYFSGLSDQTADSIKSLEGFKRAWVEEAQTFSARSLGLLRPTIREEGSQIWFSWNPRRKVDPVDVMLRGDTPPTGAVVIRANHNNNPWLPAVLEQERLDCLRDTPEQYDHIWEGGYATVLEGAYYAQALATARQEGRIGRVSADPIIDRKSVV